MFLLHGPIKLVTFVKAFSGAGPMLHECMRDLGINVCNLTKMAANKIDYAKRAHVKIQWPICFGVYAWSRVDDENDLVY